jgi:hypothetical protein
VTERPQTRSVLDATRMNKLFTVFATVDAAVASLAPVARKLSA